MAETAERRPPIPPAMAARVRSRAGYVCQKCGSDDRCEIDHITPWVIVRCHEEDNLMLLCFGCNRRKGDKVEAGRKTWFHTEYFGSSA